MPVRVPGYRWFIAGCVVMILFGGAHVGGVLHTLHEARTDARLAEQIRSLKEYTLPPILGMQTSLWSLRQFFEFVFSGLLAAWMAANFVALRLAADKAAAVRLLSLVSLAGALLIVALGAFFGVAQSVVTGGLAAVLFAIAALKARATTA